MTTLKTTPQPALEVLLNGVTEGGDLSRDDIRFLLGLTREEDIQLLFRAAQCMRRRYFGDKVFLYGFLYFSTFCRNNCLFCHFRKLNTGLERYRKRPSEIVEAARNMAASGVHLIDLTMGEDPEFFDRGEYGFDRLVRLVRSVRKETGLPVMVSPGVVPPHVLDQLADAGADWYACYQETHTPSLFHGLRRGQRYDVRMAAKVSAKRSGLLIEEGIMSGVGETAVDIAASIAMMRSLGADQVRIMTFVPQEGTPLAGATAPDSLRELLTIAVMRLAFPDRLIPASLDVDGHAGLKRRLDAGANVVTSLVPPGSGLSGVANSALDIEDARRTPEGIGPILSECRLRPAKLSEYFFWLESRKAMAEQPGNEERIAC
jgi:methylornithine synthase